MCFLSGGGALDPAAQRLYRRELLLRSYDELDPSDQIMVRELILRLSRRAQGATPQAAKTPGGDCG